MKDNINNELKYVPRKKYKDNYKISQEIIRELQASLKNDSKKLITFQPNTIGSRKQNLILTSINNNIYDFDVNLEVQRKTKFDLKKDYSEIFNTIFSCIKEKFDNYKIIKNTPKESGIIQLEVKEKNKLLFTMDIAITKRDSQNKLHILKINKWEKRNDDLENIKGKINSIKNEHLWNDVRDNYKMLKEKNINKKEYEKLPSYILFIQAINNIYNEKIIL